MSVARLGEQLYKYLFGKRYLVVMDDMWSIEVWDKMRFFFPDCNKRSRIIVTTRMSNLGAHLSSSNNSLCISFLNKVDSWTLFSNTVFGEGSAPPDLELQLSEIGDKIVKKCKGLPLSITVIGGVLAKSERTQGYWEYIEKNLDSIVNLENEEYCLRVLKLNYNHLPTYLKPCFLSMGVFDEDSEIEVSTIIKLWVSEGFVKPKNNKELEIVAREYLEELVDRNLVLAYEEVPRWSFSLKDRELGSIGVTKLCKMHDLVRDVSLREAQKQRFYYVYKEEHNPSSHRHIVIPDKNTWGVHGSRIMLKSSPNPRSYVCHDDYVDSFPYFRLLRTLLTTYSGYGHIGYRQKDLFGLVNSRLLAIAMKPERRNNVLHASISRLWSLHTLLVYSEHELEGPVEFWNMHQLKHVEFTEGTLRLFPPPYNDNIVILENLHTLIGLVDFHLNKDVVRRIPNLSIFDVSYGNDLYRKVHSLSHLQRLSKLKSFRCFIKEESRENLQKICFPNSLEQILLIDNDTPHIELEDILQKIGQLPFLGELIIEGAFFRSRNWETIEGQFSKLKSLELVRCGDLENWTVSEALHFPLLQKLSLRNLEELEEIPLEIGEIATLKSIELRLCSNSAVVSAKKIVEEQEDLYGEEELSFRVVVTVNDTTLKSLASPNFKVELLWSNFKHYLLFLLLRISADLFFLFYQRISTTFVKLLFHPKIIVIV